MTSMTPMTRATPLRTLLPGLATAATLCIASLLPQIATAKGCLKGAAVGAVGGHVAGHHAVLGAAGGCLVGRHMANKKDKQAQDPSQQKNPPSSQPNGGGETNPPAGS